ncbi:hypothetical protein ACA910_000924 [Epithemia clementina (nom. ined.)]
MNRSLTTTPKPIKADEIATTRGATTYPKEFADIVSGRSKVKLGDLFGLSNFGVNFTTLDPGSSSALLHYHKTQDEFVYILEGEATLYRLHPTTAVSGPSNSSAEGQHEKTILKAGECIGFPAGVQVAHCIRNESNAILSMLEIGDRSPNDRVVYPNDDIQATIGENGQWIFTHKDGTPFEK